MDMEHDSNKPTHSFGNGAQRSPHPRPFFYVQPPSQPYLYQHWQLNNPYGHFGLPAGFNFGRPCMHPYPYTPYPGFVLPNAPLYPMDYRRMLEPRFHASPWGDVPHHHHHHPPPPPPQPHGRRETACSGAQTDPSDAITKLIECLDKIRATELLSTNRELDSGVASQSSVVFSPGEEKKMEEQSHALPSAPLDGDLDSPAVTMSESTVYNSKSREMILDPLNPQGCWAGRLEEELPLDSSSVQEESPEPSASNEHFVSLEKEEVVDIQTSISMTDSSVPRFDAEDHRKPVSSPSFASSQLAQNEAKSCEEVSKLEDLVASCGESKAAESYQILKLPFGSVLSPGARHISSPGTPYYYSYLPTQTTHERMSVLSPSLDELSSRDEMFSTDLDDVDLFPSHVYTSRRLTEVVTGPPRAMNEDDEWFSGSKRSSCACCGRRLAKGTSRSKVHSSKIYRDEGGDSEEDGRYGRGCEQPVRVVVRKHSAPRRTPSTPRHAAKPWYKRSQYKELSELAKQEEDACKVEAAEAETELDSSERQCRTCQDRLFGEDLTTEDQGRWTDGDVIPRRRHAAPLQRQVSNKAHEDKEFNKDEPDESLRPLSGVFFLNLVPPGMEAATSTFQHPYGLGPRGPHPKPGAESSRRAPPAAPGPPRPEGQHHKPFFYIQPPQPYPPMQSLQWPVPMAMPVSYNPYYGYPGLGFGLPMMPHYQPNPYLDPPGFVVPHTHLHLMDYRRVLNTQYYQTMAYHARRFRYQHNSSARQTTSSEVQTEPLVSARRTSTLTSSECPDAAPPSTPTGQLLSDVLDVQKQNPSLELQEKVPSTTTRTPPKGSFVIQTEELRIECCTTPVGLQLLQDAADMSHSFPQDMVQCSSLVLQDEGLHLPEDQCEQELQACPDILLVGKTSTEEILPLEEPRNQVGHVTVSSNLGFPEMACPKTEETRDVSPKNLYLKGVHLPFDPMYLDELRKMESTVWSAEETLISSPELLIQNCFANSDDDLLLASGEVVEHDMLMEEPPTKEIIHVIEMFPLEEDDLQEVVSTLESEMVSDAPKAELIDTEVVLMDRSPPEADGDQSRLETNDSHPDTSFESLPTYLPSTSWLSDFDHIYYSSKTPPAPRKQIRPLSCRGSDGPKRRRKLDLDHKEQPSIRKPKERYKPRGKVDRSSFSDHECCVSRNFNENSFSPYVSKKEQLCSRCLVKRQDCTSGSGCDGQSLKRKAVPLQQWNDVLLPTCEACRPHTKRLLMRGSSPDPRRNVEGESSRNSSCCTSPQWRPLSDSGKSKDISRRPAVSYPKLREKNCFCGDLPRQSAWERLRHCPHGNTIQEMDENCTRSISLQNRWHRWQTEKPWNDVIPNMSNDRFKNESTSLHSFNHKTTPPQSQGTRTKDTRC